MATRPKPLPGEWADKTDDRLAALERSQASAAKEWQSHKTKFDALAKEQVEMMKLLKNLLEDIKKLFGFHTAPVKPAPAPVEPVIQPPAAPEPPAAVEPPVVPAPPPVAVPEPVQPVLRGRAEVTNLFLDELAKVTSFIPGGSNGSATPAETLDPRGAVQLHTTELISYDQALYLPEAELRELIRQRVRGEADKYLWAENYPPQGIPTLLEPVAPEPDNVRPPMIPAPIENGVGFWTDAQIDEAIRQMRDPNQGLVANINNNKPGWYSRGQVMMGGHLSEEGAPSWAPVTGERLPDGGFPFYPNMNFWGVIFSEVGNEVDDGLVEIADQEIQVLYRSLKAWRRIGPKNAFMIWGEHFQADMISPFNPARKIWRQPGTYGGSMAFTVPRQGSPHWIDGTGQFRVESPHDVMAVMIKMRARIDPRGNPNLKVLCHVGADSKPEQKLQYYPGIAVSSVQKLTREWRDITAFNLMSDSQGNPPQNYGPPPRAISESLIRTIRPLA